MAKISQVSAKYIIHAYIEIEGIVDRPDVIGAIFGQTEGLLGNDLELRELQRSGRIGRIEVNTESKVGKTKGDIIIPSSLDKAETSIVAAALEIIQRIGPCNSKVTTQKIEDVRISKRAAVVSRAKELLKQMVDSVMPDSQELADEVAYSVRVTEITTYGKDRLPAGPNIDEADDIVVVEGRADVLNLLKHGFKNVISVGGTGVPQTIIDLSKKKEVTAFVDGDRGGDLILKELIDVAEIDYVTKAPDGKEVEEITKKEIHKSLRSKIAAEQAKLDLDKARPTRSTDSIRKGSYSRGRESSSPRTNTRPARGNYERRPPAQAATYKTRISEKEKEGFKKMIEDLVGTHGAFLLDAQMNILGKVPTTELQSTIKSLKTGIHAVILDGAVDEALLQVVESSQVRYCVGMEAKAKGEKVKVLTLEDL